MLQRSSRPSRGGPLRGLVRGSQARSCSKGIESSWLSGSGKGADLCGRILRGNDEERARQWMCFAVGRDLFFLGDLEQRALGLRGRAVDLVGENQLRERSARMESESTASRSKMDTPKDVCGQQVAGELDALEVQTEQSGEEVGERRLPTPGISSMSR